MSDRGRAQTSFEVQAASGTEVLAVQEAGSPNGNIGSPNLPIRSSFVWMLGGNIVYAICQWGMVVALAKLGSSLMLGQFSLGLAIATPVLMLSNLNLRSVQATDATRSYLFREYRQLRCITTAGALLAVTGLVWVGGYSHSTAIVILGVASAKGIDTLSDIYYGLFQQHDRLDRTATSMVLRGVLAVTALSVSLYATRNVFGASLSVSSVWLLALWLYDARQARRILGVSQKRAAVFAGGTPRSRQWHLLRLAFPLGVVTALASVNLNIPRYFIYAQKGGQQLGVFSAMAYATVAITLISDSLGHASIPKLSRLYAERRLGEFRSLLVRLLVACTVLGVTALAAAQIAGGRLLTIIYSREYASHSNVFTVLILATVLNGIASMLTCGITSARCFGIQVPLFAMAAASSVLGCILWVPAHGLTGGAAAMVCGAAVRLVLSVLVAYYLLAAGRKSLEAAKHGCGYSDWRPAA